MSILKIDSAPAGPLKTFLDRAFRTIELWAKAEQMNGAGQYASLNLSNLQTDGWGLRIGDVFIDRGVVSGPVGWGGVVPDSSYGSFLRIVRDGEWYLRGTAMHASVGTVTVTIT